MSAYIVSKYEIDLLVRAALHYKNHDCNPPWPLQWWQTNSEGGFERWRVLLDPEGGERADADTSYSNPSQVGQILVNENVASVHARYPDTEPDAGDLPGPVDAYYMGPYVYQDPGVALEPGALFRAIDHYDYQACEHEGWMASEAYAFLRALRERACTTVPGYKEAPWGYDRKEVSP
jgi:hypothetical protein